jgi:hypothetical protein
MTPRLAAAIVGLLMVLPGCSSGPSVGAEAPSFTAEDARGETVSLASFEGSVLILDFWAVW